ncbi:MAG: GDSL-type esterase/lipase family protein [Planctomycetaceae bacterium]|nr:GDSL-type esterase/lipase family protein [Planctomycetaceae bacterium]
MKHNTKVVTYLFAITCALLSSGCLSEQQTNTQRQALNKQSIENYTHPDRWKDDIQKFIDSDKQTSPPQNAVLFVGSSSIRMWDTKKFFPDIETINRGFGGSFVIDSLYYADQIILPYKPKTIVFYAGDNDTVCNKPSEMIAADFQSLFYKVRQTLPETRIIYISIKPSISRWNYWPQMIETNKLIEIFCKKQQNIHFVDVSKVLLDSDGKPRKDLLKDDGLHLNDKGYELWTSLVRPLIDK